ncbi:DUF5693 family protein [Halobacillus sp. K22]|uniref:DUF5693 family protein n=1 Tax=Halobacillus sp. K22 TaxID=3457431 RepID=UPI003FCD0B33
MNKSRVLWIIIILLLTATIPSLSERSSLERAQDDYELVLPYKHIKEMAGADASLSSVLNQLQAAGLTAVLVDMKESSLPEEAVSEITDADLEVIVSVGAKSAENWKQQLDAAVHYYSREADYVHISGNKVPGYPDTADMNQFADILSEGKEGVYFTEFQRLDGFKEFTEDLNYNVIRMHDLDLLHGHQTVEEKVDRTLRAVKERNQRSILLSSMEADTLDHTVTYLEKITEAMPSGFELKEADGWKDFSPPLWATLASFLAGILFIYQSLVSIFRYRLIGWLAASASIGLMAAYLITDSLLFLQGFALGVGLVTPVCAVKATAVGSTRIREITLSYAKALGISLIGIVIIIGLLNGTVFLTGIALFRGVKLLYVVPLLFFGVYALWGLTFKEVKQSVKGWHLILFVLVGAAAVYYVLRSGNSQAVSELELWFRTKLEDWLYARPRSKEFLLGFPAYLLALAVLPRFKRIGKMLLIPGVIGFMSIVNTFTHLHIPLHISMLRTGYSIVFGYIIGLLAIGIYKLIIKKRIR